MIKFEDLKIGIIIQDFEIDFITKINTRNVHFNRSPYIMKDWLPINHYLEITNDYNGKVYTDIFCEE